MKRLVYNAVVAKIDSQTVWDFQGCLDMLKKEFPDEKPEQIRSVLYQRYQKRVKASIMKLTSPRNRKAMIEEYMIRARDRRQKPGFLLEMARRENFSPVLLSRIIIEEWFKAKGQPISKSEITKYVKNSLTIPDKQLAFEVYKADTFDDICSSISDAIKHSIGVEHEEMLKKHLDDLGIAFQDEAYCRKMGFDKTPDVRLEVPFAVNGNIVNWIESKALFGDEENHATYLKEQLWSYWNRFGPGMVIYWFGFIDEINDVKKHEGILVCDSFPKKEDIVFFDPLHNIEEIMRYDPSSEEDQALNFKDILKEIGLEEDDDDDDIEEDENGMPKIKLPDIAKETDEEFKERFQKELQQLRLQEDEEHTEESNSSSN